MNKQEYIKMLHQDAVTSPTKDQDECVINMIEECLATVGDVEVDSSKTAADVYKAMKEYASKNQKDKSYYFGKSEKHIKVVLDALGVKKANIEMDKPQAKSHRINLEDYM